MAPDNGWNEWSRHVLAELERLNEGQITICNTLTHVREEIATLKVKSGMWGVIGGCIPLLITFAVYILTKQ